MSLLGVKDSWAAQTAVKDTVPAGPTHVWIEPTTRCNTRCAHCLHYYHSFGADMDEATFARIRDSALDGARSAELVGLGEPLIAPLFDRILDECRRRGIAIRTTTNGCVLTTDDKVARFVEAGAELVVSLDGARAETYEFVRPGLKWERMIEILERIKRVADTMKRQGSTFPAGAAAPAGAARSADAADGPKRFSLQFNYVALKRSIGDLPELVRLAGKYGAGKILVFPLSGEQERQKVRGEGVHGSPELVSRAYREALSLAARLRVHVTVPPSFRPLIVEGAGIRDGRPLGPVAARAARLACLAWLAWMALRSKGVSWLWRRALFAAKPRAMAGTGWCMWPWDSAYFAADGQVYPCCVLGGAMGDLRRQEWGEIWNGAWYRNLRRTIHSWNPSRMCRCCGMSNGINGGDENQYQRFFSRFRAESIPLDDGAVRFGPGCYELERDSAGAAHHRWLGPSATLSLPMRKGARFVRFEIVHCSPNGEVNFGQCRINGGAPEPFDTSCPEIVFPLKDRSAGRIEARFEMERVFAVEGDERGLSWAVRGIQLLY